MGEKNKADIELNSECGLCNMAIKGDESAIHCNPCYWLPKEVCLDMNKKVV